MWAGFCDLEGLAWRADRRRAEDNSGATADPFHEYCGQQAGDPGRDAEQREAEAGCRIEPFNSVDMLYRGTPSDVKVAALRRKNPDAMASRIHL